MKLLITGHTGFKGAWLTMLATQLGHSVSGISLPPTSKSLYTEANCSKLLAHDLHIDIRNLSEISKAVEKINPEVVVHLAAQALVLESYNRPLETIEVNVLGTANVIQASSYASNLVGSLIITSDKVYKNMETGIPFVETDPLGGNDPYSASKAAADLLTQSWRISNSTKPIGIARAGNVIGGGDWSNNRLIPDLVKAFDNFETPSIRNPSATRPWQHVLDCLNGYMMLIDSISDPKFSSEWNFGPQTYEMHTVAEVAHEFSKIYNKAVTGFSVEEVSNRTESKKLAVNSDKARKQLGWSERYSFLESIEATAKWYLDSKSLSSEVVSQRQINSFLSMNGTK